jgi:hypothetical protein
MKIQIGDIVMLGGTNQYGIVIKRQSSNGYIVDWFEYDDKAIYYSFHLIKVSQ